MAKYLKLLLIVIIVVVTGCQEDFETGGTEAREFAGEWWVQFYISDTEVHPYGYYQVFTSNTSANMGDSLIVKEPWNETSVKVGCDYTTLTFSANGVISTDGDYSYNVVDGKVILKGAKSPGGLVTDSIYFKLVDLDDADNTVIMAGYRHTGWPEDMH